MSLYDRARKDNAKILGASRGFTVPVILLSPTGNEYSTRCFFIDVSNDINPQTGMMVVGRRVAISVSLYDENGALLLTENPADNTGTWKATITYNGTTETRLVTDPMIDRTLGSITMTLKRLKTEVV